MNILFLAQRVPYPPNKGEKIRTFHQIKFLKELGHAITVAAPIEDNNEYEYFEALEKQYCQQTVKAKPAPRFWRLLRGLFKNQSLSVANFHSKLLQQKIDKLLNSLKPDVIFCTSSSMAEYVFQSCLFKNAKLQERKTLLVMDFMDLDSDKWQQYAKHAKFPMRQIYVREAKLLSSYEQRVHRDFDACLFTTQAEIDLFLEIAENSGKLYPIANGLDTDFFKPANKDYSQAPVLLFTGVMDYLPNIDAVVWFVENTWLKIKEIWPGATFIIAGMNPTNKVEALTKYDGIIITGFVDDIRSYYDKAHYFIAPLRVARGLQNKLLQAFACGLPVVSTDAAAEGIDCQKGTDLLIANTAQEFVEQLLTIHDNNNLRQTIINNALTLVKDHYSWHGRLEMLENILTEKTIARYRGRVDPVHTLKPERDFD